MSGESAAKRTSTKNLSIDGTTGQFVGSALPVIFSKPIQYIDIHYMPGGKDEIAHDSEIKLDVAVDFARDTAADEKAQSAMTVLGFAGVSGELKAYAIHTNGQRSGRRRERANPLRGWRSQRRRRLAMPRLPGVLGRHGHARTSAKSPMIGGNERAWYVSKSMAIEGVTGIPAADHVASLLPSPLEGHGHGPQQLTRDGNSGGTLVNNTYVGGHANDRQLSGPDRSTSRSTRSSDKPGSARSRAFFRPSFFRARPSPR